MRDSYQSFVYRMVHPVSGQIVGVGWLPFVMFCHLDHLFRQFCQIQISLSRTTKTKVNPTHKFEQRDYTVPNR